VLRSGVLPNTKAALEAGELTAGHAQVVATAVVGAPADAVALIEPPAVEVAVESDVAATAAVMRCFQNALDPDAADAAAVRRYDRAGLTLSQTLGGSMSLSGLADEVSGATIATAVDLASPLVSGDSRTAARRRLDGLVEICNRYLSDPTAPRRGGGGRPHLVVTIDEPGLQGAALAGGSATAPSPGGSLSWIGPVASSTAGRVGCDSMATFVTLGPDGEVVEAGTQRRFFTVAQRRAIVARDGDQCCAPFCDRPVAWSDAHHLVAVEDGGPTTVANGSLPCEAHHVMVHEGRWRLRRLPDGRYQLFHPGTGIVLGPEPFRLGRGRPLPHRRE
jgi:hypothetical protein